MAWQGGVHAHGCRCSRRTEEGASSPRTGATGRCKLSDMDAENHTWVVCRSTKHTESSLQTLVWIVTIPENLGTDSLAPKQQRSEWDFGEVTDLEG